MGEMGASRVGAGRRRRSRRPGRWGAGRCRRLLARGSPVAGCVRIGTGRGSARIGAGVRSIAGLGLGGVGSSIGSVGTWLSARASRGCEVGRTCCGG